jgi:hypothetical protein
VSETSGLNRLSGGGEGIVNLFFKVVDKVIRREGGGREWRIKEGGEGRK